MKTPTQAPKPIGILGGMGPQATILLQQKLLDSVSVDDEAAHIPLIIDMNPQVPSRIDWLLHGKGENPGPVLAAMARRLEASGAVALAMPCNTAHHFAPAVQSAISIPFLHMLDMVANECAALSQVGESVGVLASPATRGIRLFEQTLDSVNLNTVWPESPVDLLAPIKNIKVKGVEDADRDLLQNAADDCIRQGATCLLIGCTEFSLMSDTISSEVPIVDSIELLVNGIRDVAFSASAR